MSGKIRKIILYSLVSFLVIAGGFAMLAKNVAAQSPAGDGTCYDPNVIFPEPKKPTNLTREQCGANSGNSLTGEKAFEWVPKGSTNPVAPVTPYDQCVTGGKTPAECSQLTGAPQQSASPTENGLDKAVAQLNCVGIFNGSLEGCIVKGAYIVLYQLPGLVLAMVANFFNSMLALTLGSKMYESSFVTEGWAIVRDFSNIFFILVLLYVALKVILGLAGHGVKQTIVKVVIVALLINFSMFFTKIVIDTSNVLALIFYNKISTVGPNQQPLPYEQNFNAGVQEKDIGGAFMTAFNPARLTDQEMFEKAKEKKQTDSLLKTVAKIATGVVVPIAIPFMFGEDIPATFFLSIIVISGMMFLYVSYVFFIAAWSFLGRLIELWVLIIASPFAFMSSTVPFLEKVEHVGWHSWWDKLLQTAFMAPIFMFFLYLISKLIQINIFKDFQNTANEKFVTAVLFIVIPTIINVVLLQKAAAYAKKGAGQIGEMVTKLGAQAGSLVAGVGLGVATGGAAMLGRATIGKVGADLASNASLKETAKMGGFGGFMANRVLDAGKLAGSASFDARAIKIAGKSLADTGANVGKAQEGGFIQARKDAIKKRQERAKELEVSEDEPLKQHLNELELDRQQLLRDFGHEIELLDNKIKGTRENANDLNGAASRASTAAQTLRKKAERTGAQADIDAADEAERQAEEATEKAKQAQDKLAELKAHKKAIKTGGTFTRTALTAEEGEELGEISYAGARVNGLSIDDLEDRAIPHAHDAIEKTNRERKWQYIENFNKGLGGLAAYAASGGAYTKAAAREAEHKIKMEAKIEDSGGHGKKQEAHHAPAAHAAPAHAPAAHPEPDHGGDHGHGNGEGEHHG